MIGAGVLSLAWSTAQLGWVAGPLAILVFAAITQLSTLLVCDCYRSPDPAYGPTLNRSFIQAVKFYLGPYVYLSWYDMKKNLYIKQYIVDSILVFQGKRSRKSVQYLCLRASMDVALHILSSRLHVSSKFTRSC